MIAYCIVLTSISYILFFSYQQCESTSTLHLPRSFYMFRSACSICVVILYCFFVDSAFSFYGDYSLLSSFSLYPLLDRSECRPLSKHRIVKCTTNVSTTSSAVLPAHLQSFQLLCGCGNTSCWDLTSKD